MTRDPDAVLWASLACLEENRSFFHILDTTKLTHSRENRRRRDLSLPYEKEKKINYERSNISFVHLMVPSYLSRVSDLDLNFDPDLDQDTLAALPCTRFDLSASSIDAISSVPSHFPLYYHVLLCRGGFLLR